MSTNSIQDRLAVCSWSLQSTGADQLVQFMKSLGQGRVQIALDPIRTNPDAWSSFLDSNPKHGFELVSGMFVTVGEDYSTLETIRETGGVVPDSTWDENWANIQANAKLAKDLGLKLATFHAGFLPEDKSLPEYSKLRGRLAKIADVFGEQGVDLGLETGQEDAGALLDFLEDLGCSNVGVNFDPANMILYDKGDPVASLHTLAPWLKQCHIKDATKTAQPGTWGAEVAVGAGHVDWPGFFKALHEIGYTGDLAVEREAGLQRLEDIRTAIQHVTSLS